MSAFCTLTALTDTEMVLVCADRLRKGGEILFYKGSFAYDKAEIAGEELLKSRGMQRVADYKTLAIYRKT